jgi:hypothetical protein
VVVAVLAYGTARKEPKVVEEESWFGVLRVQVQRCSVGKNQSAFRVVDETAILAPFQ